MGRIEMDGEIYRLKLSGHITEQDAFPLSLVLEINLDLKQSMFPVNKTW